MTGGVGRRRRGVHRHRGVRLRDRRHGEDGHRERADADRRGRGQLRSVVLDRDDHREHHCGDDDARDHGGEQGRTTATTSATLTSCTVTGALGGDVVACTGTATLRHGDRRHGQDGHGERPDADRRGGGQLRPGVPDRDDHRRDHGADGDTGRRGGEQGLRRDDGGDADELHGDGRARRRCGGVHRHRRALTRRVSARARRSP